MRKIIFTTVFIAVFALIVSCKASKTVVNQENPLVGKWKLIAAYVDPGNGSGGFRSVESDKSLQFTKDGKVISSNGELCSINRANQVSENSTYTFVGDNSSNKRLKIDKCPSEFAIEVDDNELVIYYLCIEKCGEKFVRIKD